MFRCRIILQICLALAALCACLVDALDDDCVQQDTHRIEELEKELADAQHQLNQTLEELRSEEEKAHWWATSAIDDLKAASVEIAARDLEVVDPAPNADPFSRACTNEERLRLVNGSSDFEGRLEVKEGNQWMTVCGDSMNRDVARDICAMLGYPRKDVAAVGSKVFGNDYSLSVLPASGTCREAAGLVCGGLENYPVRLVGGSGPYEGRVELQVNGRWGSLCDNSWDTTEALVICRILGYTSGGALATVNGFFGNATGEQWGYQFSCDGTESHIMSCGGTANYLTGSLYACSATDAAGVVCSNFYHYPLRLVNGSTPYEGRVEVRINNHWVQIYSGNWDNNEATVVCRQLGYSSVGARAVGSSQFGYSGVGQAELGYFNCRGDEQHLLACPASYPVNYNTWNAASNIAGVICQP